MTARKVKTALPTKHSVRADQLLVMSDFRFPREHPLIDELVLLRQQVAQTLHLPLKSREVVVYLFRDQSEYQHYLSTAYPGLPERRAYFVGSPRELAVFSYWGEGGERIQEDLRHEFTHGLLHASLKHVPLWLDEGLAEYFEVVGPAPGEVNQAYAGRLTQSIANGWEPDLENLERLDEFASMQGVDYQEAWAWVHFMLHSSPDSRQVLLEYVAELSDGPVAQPLAEQLDSVIPNRSDRLKNYVASLSVPGNTYGSL